MTTCPHCGCDINKPADRSTQQLRRYFKLIRSAFDAWPEAHEFHPRSADELRKWLQAKAGHRKFVMLDVDPGNVDLVKSVVTTLLEMLQDYAWTVPMRDGRLAIVMSDSIKYESMGHQAFCNLNDDVEALIEHAIGVSVDDLLRESA